MLGTITEQKRETQIVEKVDVVIVGGGVSGCSAALAASRQGASIILLERSGMLGGVVTLAGMSSITNIFFAEDDKQIVRGIAKEILEELVRRDAMSPNWQASVFAQNPFDPNIFQSILYEKLKKSGARVLTHNWAVDAILEDGQARGVIVHNRAGRQAIQAKNVIDATGDLDMIAASGAPFHYPSPGSASLLFELGGVNLQDTYEYFLENPNDYTEGISRGLTFDEFKDNWSERGLFLIPHHGGRNISVLQEAIKRGEYYKEKGLGEGLDALMLCGLKGKGRVLVNSNFFCLDEINEIEKFSRAELEARERCLELYDVLKRVMPGFENSFITRIGSELGSRRTRCLDGKYQLTWEDVQSGKKFDDVIGVLRNVPELGKASRNHAGTVDLPYRMMLPKKVDNLLVGTGKGASAEETPRMRLVRMQPACMVLGQAAGTAAALAAKTGETTQEIEIEHVQSALLASDVYLGRAHK